LIFNQKSKIKNLKCLSVWARSIVKAIVWNP